MLTAPRQRLLLHKTRGTRMSARAGRATCSLTFASNSPRRRKQKLTMLPVRALKPSNMQKSRQSQKRLDRRQPLICARVLADEQFGSTAALLVGDVLCLRDRSSCCDYLRRGGASKRGDSFATYKTYQPKLRSADKRSIIRKSTNELCVKFSDKNDRPQV